MIPAVTLGSSCAWRSANESQFPLGSLLVFPTRMPVLSRFFHPDPWHPGLRFQHQYPEPLSLSFLLSWSAATDPHVTTNLSRVYLLLARRLSNLAHLHDLTLPHSPHLDCSLLINARLVYLFNIHSCPNSPRCSYPLLPQNTIPPLQPYHC